MYFQRVLYLQIINDPKLNKALQLKKKKNNFIDPAVTLSTNRLKVK